MKNKVKSENRKAMPLFIVIMVLALLIGAVVGILAIKYADADLAAVISEGLASGLALISPYAIWVCVLVPLVMAVVNLKKVKKEFAAWQEDDMDAMKTMDAQLTAPLSASAICTILNYFFFAALFCFMKELELTQFVIGFLGFVAHLISSTVVQQKVVDMNKKLNPEKRGSVYDMKFNEKYIASCDEAEKAMIYEAGYTGYGAMNLTCIFMWLVLVLGHMFFSYGLLPIATVTFIWLVGTVSYLCKAAKLEKGKK